MAGYGRADRAQSGMVEPRDIDYGTAIALRFYCATLAPESVDITPRCPATTMIPISEISVAPTRVPGKQRGPAGA